MNLKFTFTIFTDRENAEKALELFGESLISDPHDYNRPDHDGVIGIQDQDGNFVEVNVSIEREP